MLADRLSVNIELPSEAGLKTLAPDKTKQAILAPMRQIQTRSQQSREELVKYRHAPRFAPRRPEHPTDRGGHGGLRPAHPAADPGTVRPVPSQTGVLFPPTFPWWSTRCCPPGT